MTVSIGYTVATVSALKALDPTEFITGYLRYVVANQAWYQYHTVNYTEDTVNKTIYRSNFTGSWLLVGAYAFSSQVVGLEESVEDIVASLVTNNSFFTWVYSDVSGTLQLNINNGVLTNVHISDSAAIAQSKILGLTSSLAGKANTSHNHVYGSVTDFLDGVYVNLRDTVLVAGSNVTLTSNNTNKTITINSSTPSASMEIAKDGTVVGTQPQLNFTGTNISVTEEAGQDRVTVSVSSGGSGSLEILDEGVSIGSRSVLNFIGSSVTATDDAANSKVDISISGGGNVSLSPTEIWDDILIDDTYNLVDTLY